MPYEGIVWVASVMLAMFSVLIEGDPFPSSLLSASGSSFPLLSALCFCLLFVLHCLLSSAPTLLSALCNDPQSAFLSDDPPSLLSLCFPSLHFSPLL